MPWSESKNEDETPSRTAIPMGPNWVLRNISNLGNSSKYQASLNHSTPLVPNNVTETEGCPTFHLLRCSKNTTKKNFFSTSFFLLPTNIAPVRKKIFFFKTAPLQIPSQQVMLSFVDRGSLQHLEFLEKDSLSPPLLRQW